MTEERPRTSWRAGTVRFPMGPVACLTLSTLLAGCCCREKIKPICPDPPEPPPSVLAVCEAINENTARVQTLFAPKVRLTAKTEGRTDDLDAMLAVGTGRRMHLLALHGLLGEVMDVGSNDYHVWVWSRVPESEEGLIRKSTHRELDAQLGSRRGTVLLPHDIREALGLVRFDFNGWPVNQYREVGAETIAVVTLRYPAGRGGGPLFLFKKTIVNRCDLRMILRQEVWGTDGKLAIVAELSEHFVAQGCEAMLPGRVKIRLLRPGWTIDLRLGDVELNTELGDEYWQPHMDEDELRRVPLFWTPEGPSSPDS